jgi:hypothetical protein
MLNSLPPLPIEIYEIITVKLESFIDFVNFKNAFGISNSLIYSGKSSVNIDEDLNFILNRKSEIDVVERTLIKMFKKSVILASKLKPAAFSKLLDKNFINALDICLQQMPVKPNLKYFHACKTTDACLILLKNGFPSDITDKAGNTFLHQCDNIEFAKMFLDCGANPNPVNISHRTPLHTCISSEIAQLLLKAGAEVNVADKEGKTALHEHANDLEIITVLLKFSANADAADLAGKTILHLT